jgi:hypothetical protein
MGNPAEKTTGHLTADRVAELLPALANIFFRFFRAVDLAKSSPAQTWPGSGEFAGCFLGPPGAFFVKF